MLVRDTQARVTPYELAFPGREDAAHGFRMVREEAVSMGLDLADPATLARTGAAGVLLAGMRQAGDDPLVVQQFRELLFHCIHFFFEGEPVYLLETAAARYLVEGTPDLAGWMAGDLPRAGYLQLPRHLFWARPLEQAPPEPLDGLFWTAPGNEMVSTLVVTGMREDRPGFSAVPLPPLPVVRVADWGSARVRGEGEDFGSTLPGGELEQLYSVETHGEVLKLLARVLWYVECNPGRLSPPSSAGREEQGSGRRVDRPNPASPTALPYRRIRLD